MEKNVGNKEKIIQRFYGFKIYYAIQRKNINFKLRFNHKKIKKDLESLLKMKMKKLFLNI